MNSEEIRGTRHRNLGGEWDEREQLAREIKRSLFCAPTDTVHNQGEVGLTPTPVSTPHCPSDFDWDLERACANLGAAIHRIPETRPGVMRRKETTPAIP